MLTLHSNKLKHIVHKSYPTCSHYSSIIYIEKTLYFKTNLVYRISVHRHFVCNFDIYWYDQTTLDNFLIILDSNEWWHFM
jgi:hypothetical protein